MRVVNQLEVLQRGAPTILTIGAFDGVHRGHQSLIRGAVERARALQFESLVVTFEPRPQVALRPGSFQLTGAREKARIVGAIGPTTLAVLPFTRETSLLPAGQFVASLLDHVNLAEVWVGADFAFGHNREGNVDFLIRSGQNSGFGVHVVSRQKLGPEPISSTEIRRLVREGHLDQAAVLLGHFVALSGRVVPGEGRGRGMGFPTANLDLPAWQLLPEIGIYAGYLRLDGQRHQAAVSVGTNPTFGGDHVIVEAFVLDFDGELSGREVDVDLVKRIRAEKRFDSAEDLVAEMTRDVEKAREILDAVVEPGELLLDS
jgi:riboflavin kinase/FMN adenylyltransferase